MKHKIMSLLAYLSPRWPMILSLAGLILVAASLPGEGKQALNATGLALILFGTVLRKRRMQIGQP